MNSFNHFNELRRHQMRTRSITRELLIVLACVVAIVLIQTFGK